MYSNKLRVMHLSWLHAISMAHLRSLDIVGTASVIALCDSQCIKGAGFNHWHAPMPPGWSNGAPSDGPERRPPGWFWQRGSLDRVQWAAGRRGGGDAVQRCIHTSSKSSAGCAIEPTAPAARANVDG